MKAKKELLATAVIAAFALLMTGTMLADSATYELPHREWSSLFGGYTGVCTTGSGCNYNDNPCWTRGSGNCHTVLINNGYDQMGCVGSTGTCTLSNYGACVVAYDCTWNGTICYYPNWWDAVFTMRDCTDEP